jgi:7-carboxy-7-deazaguanine synthase
METLLPSTLGRLGPEELLVNETFLSIQGESTHAGRPCFFIRLAGCHLRCSWCDTEYAFHEGRVRPVADCLAEAEAARQRLVEVTGGEPLLQKAVHRLLSGLCDRGHEVLLETGGALPIDRVDPRVRRIVDLKCPQSGMASRNDLSIVRSLRAGDELKLVLADRGDYEWARRVVRELQGRLPEGVPILLSPVFGGLPPSNLARWILDDALPARMSLQLHKLIWGSTRRGV